MTHTAVSRPTEGDVESMLCARNETLEQEKAELAEQLEASETRVEALTGAVRRARAYAGEHLPAAAGTGIVHILESALREAVS